MFSAVLCLVSACTDRPTPAATDPGPASPDVNGVEGHGGIAIVEPGPAPVVGQKVAPSAVPQAGKVDPEQFVAEGAAGYEVKELYLRGYQMKDSMPKEAAELFRRVKALTAPTDEYHQKADAQLRQLGVP